MAKAAIIFGGLFDRALVIESPTGINDLRTKNPQYIVSGSLQYLHGVPTFDRQNWLLEAPAADEIDTVWIGNHNYRDAFADESIEIEIDFGPSVVLNGLTKYENGIYHSYGPFAGGGQWGRLPTESTLEHTLKHPVTWAMIRLDTPVRTNRVNVVLNGTGKQLARIKVGKQWAPDETVALPYGLGREPAGQLARRLNGQAVPVLRRAPRRVEAEWKNLRKQDVNNFIINMNITGQGFEVVYSSHPETNDSRYSYDTMLCHIVDAPVAQMYSQREPYSEQNLRWSQRVVLEEQL